jgi:AFG3 family protein
MLDEMCATLGGRASEEINFSKISTGALNDLERVTKTAYAMISYYGMSSKVGNLSFYDSSGQTDFTFSKPYSDKTAELIDQEVKLMVEIQYERAKKLLSENKEGLKQLSKILLEKEVIFSEDVEKIFGPRIGRQPEHMKKLTKRRKPAEPDVVTEETPVKKSRAKKKNSTDEKGGEVR